MFSLVNFAHHLSHSLHGGPGRTRERTEGQGMKKRVHIFLLKVFFRFTSLTLELSMYLMQLCTLSFAKFWLIKTIVH